MCPFASLTSGPRNGLEAVPLSPSPFREIDVIEMQGNRKRGETNDGDDEMD